MKDNKQVEAEKIVEENFKGLDHLIDDKDLLLWYKDLIVTCMIEFASTPPCSDKMAEEAAKNLLSELKDMEDRGFDSIEDYKWVAERLLSFAAATQSRQSSNA